MSTLVTVVHVCTCVFLVLMVLIQSGKGAEISASFGGSSQTVFGSSGGANFFVKLTGALAAVFFTTSILLTILAGQSHKSLFETSPVMPATAPVTQTAPVSQPAGSAQSATQPAQGGGANASTGAAAPVSGAPANSSAASGSAQTPSDKKN